ncbi:MAG: NAD(P)-dependent oxidoreductase [Coriobacteriales bacterium]|nr:NAD(P)-dependent oxidoreductase [Coriobacteriales bacterium]
MEATRPRDVAFVGTGIMGSAIAGHLLDAGYSVTVHTRTKEKAAGLLSRGARWADTVAQAAERADVVFTMVGYPEEVEEVYLSTNGLIRTCKKGAWMVDLTTSAPQLARDIHDAAEVMDKHAVDCPVTGGEAGARQGTLTLMLGCAQRAAEPIVPLLQTFSSRILYFDVAGNGQVAKLCNQVALAANMVGYAEAFAIAEQAGIEAGRIRDLVQGGTGASAAMEQLAPLSLEGDYRPGFMSEHLRKDLGLALELADELGLNLPGTDGAAALVDLLCRVGGSRLGTQALTLLYQDEASGIAAGLDWSAAAGEDDHEHECACGEHCCGHGECDHHE